jgi:MFS family permease
VTTPSIEAAGPPSDLGTAPPSGSSPQLGLRENWWQFSLFTVITLLIGMTIGVERVALPPLAHHAFGITSVLYTVSFISAFGAVKSAMNLVAGRLSDRRGRKMILLAGWGFAVPYALIIIFATAWWQVIVANLFLGVNQALTWTMSVTAKIDLVGPVNRGLAVGVDESAGYIGVGLGGFAAGLLVSSYGLRPTPYLLALGVVALGALLTLGPAKETLHFARHESLTQHMAIGDAAVVSNPGPAPEPAAATEPGAGAGNAITEPGDPGASRVGDPTAVAHTLTGPSASAASPTFPPARAAPPTAATQPTAPGTADEQAQGSSHPPAPNLRRLAAYMSWHDRSMLAVCQAGFLNKFADSLVAAFFPLYLARHGVALADVGLLVGVYAWVWGLGQVAAGALADRIGRKMPITIGTLLIAGGLALFVATADHGAWFAGAALMGLGMALAYPNLITSVGDVADPSWRGGALGVYRLWRDGGYAIGPLVLGVIAALGGITAALWAGVAFVGASGIVLLLLLRETDPRRRRQPPAWSTHPEWVSP